MAAPARRLDPGIFAALVELFDIRLRALGLGAELVMRLGDSIPGVETLALVRIFVPGMGDIFLDLFRVGVIYGEDLLEIAVDDRAARQLQARLRIESLACSGTSP